MVSQPKGQICWQVLLVLPKTQCYSGHRDLTDLGIGRTYLRAAGSCKLLDEPLLMGAKDPL